MGRTWVTLLVAVLALAACSPRGSTSHVEQVDVPVVVGIRLAPGREVACRKDHRWIHLFASVTTDPEEGVWARNCSATVLDGDGEVLAMTPFEFGPPAGVCTREGTTSRIDGGLEVEIAPARQDRIRALDASCRAYEWHGDRPSNADQKHYRPNIR